MSLEMLTKAADLVETQEKQKRLGESPSPTGETRKITNHVNEAKPRDPRESNDNVESRTNGTKGVRRHDHISHNGNAHNHSKEVLGADLARTVNNHDGKGNKEDEKTVEENNSSDHRPPVDSGQQLLDPARYLYQQRLIGQANGLQLRADKRQRTEDNSTARQSPERYQPTHRRSASPAAERRGETQPATKPMVLLQHPAATTLSTVGSAHAAPLTNPALHASTMHHPYMYSLMYPTGAVLDPPLSSLGRVPGSVLKEGEGHASPPNGSPNANISTVASGMHFPTAAFMHPFANQAFLMGAARPPGAVADISPLLLAQSYHVPGFADQYKRLLEGMQPLSTAYSLQPQLTDQYFKSLAAAQGFDASKDPLALSGLAGRLPAGISLAALQGQPGAAELLMRYPELNAMGLLRPHEGMSPRSASPYSNNRRTDSPVITNGGKIPTSYPYHPSLAQPHLNALSAPRTHVRSPAAIFTQSHRSRSPAAELRKPEVDRSGYRSHSRDLDRDTKPNAKDLASASTSGNHIRMNDEHLAAHSYSVTDTAGRKITLPPFYTGPSVHVPHGYPMGLSAHHSGHERSPSPHSRPNEDRGYHRPQRERSPVMEIQNKRRSLESHFVARNSPVLNDRHNSRPTSPTTNGQIQAARHQLPLLNGSAEAAAELAKVTQHLLVPTGHTRSPNASAFANEGREQRSGSPPPHPYLAAAAGVPYFNQQLLSGLAAGSPLLLPQYAALAAKGADLTSLYKAAENSPEYARIAGLPAGLPPSLAGLSLPLLSSQQLAGGRAPHVLPQDYAAAALKAHYFASPPGSKESGKASPANAKEKIPGMPQQINPSLLLQQPPQALSPAKVGMRAKHSSSPQLSKPGHHPHTTAKESHSPTAEVGSSALPSSEARRYHSPNMDRPVREVSPKSSSKPYRPNSMLRQHADDLERSRKRKMEEMGIREDAYIQEKHHAQTRPEQREYVMKDARKDPKRRKQLITEADPDVEEHFRLSLGKDYKETCNKVSISGTVDDHFKKSLGERWDKVRTAASSMPVKSEIRDSAPHSATTVLPSYSAAIAAATQTVRAYASHADSKEAVARMYDPAFLARERFYNLPAPQRKMEKSPPRAPPQPAPTVLYPPNPPIGPVRQKVKAKAFIPEAPPVAPDLTNNNRSVRASSLGSKGSSRSISGSSAESVPVGLTKSPPASSPSAVVEGLPRPLLPPVNSSAIPFTFAHHQSAPSIAIASQGIAQAGSPESNLMPRQRSSPTSPRAPVSEGSTRNQSSPNHSFANSNQEPRERRKSEEGRSST